MFCDKVSQLYAFLSVMPLEIIDPAPPGGELFQLDQHEIRTGVARDQGRPGGEVVQAAPRWTVVEQDPDTVDTGDHGPGH